MPARMIDHWDIVKAIDNGRATVVVETTACGTCGHGGHCGVGRAAHGLPATTLQLPAEDGLRVGDFVHVGLPESGLSLAALVGYLFPALATLLGAFAGYFSGGGDAAMAIGAGAGFLASLVVARIAIAFTPGLSPAPRIIPPSALSPTFPQE